MTIFCNPEFFFSFYLVSDVSEPLLTKLHELLSRSLLIVFLYQLDAAVSDTFVYMWNVSDALHHDAYALEHYFVNATVGYSFA